MIDQTKSILAARNAFNALYNISQILNTGLSKEELMICVRLCEKGVNPNMLANIITAMKTEMKNLNEKAANDPKSGERGF